MKTVFTSGQVAKVCKVAPRTVSKWIDSGRLKGYRIPPSGDHKSGDRRVTRDNLIKFLRSHDMPQAAELEAEGGTRVLLVGVGAEFVNWLESSLAGVAGLRVESADKVFDAGLMVHEFRPHVILIDLAVGRSEAVHVAAAVRKSEAPADGPKPGNRAGVNAAPARPAVLVALAYEDEAGEEGLTAAGFDVVARRPWDAAALAKVIRTTLEV